MIIKIDVNSQKPIYEQLYEQIVIGISSGLLKPNESLPSVRRLAIDLGINMHTVNKAYNALADVGYLIINRKGTIVNSSVDLKENFRKRIMESLKLLAAEAKCHSYDIGDFLIMCKESYDLIGEKYDD